MSNTESNQSQRDEPPTQDAPSIPPSSHSNLSPNSDEASSSTTSISHERRPLSSSKEKLPWDTDLSFLGNELEVDGTTASTRSQHDNDDHAYVKSRRPTSKSHPSRRKRIVSSTYSRYQVVPEIELDVLDLDGRLEGKDEDDQFIPLRVGGAGLFAGLGQTRRDDIGVRGTSKDMDDGSDVDVSYENNDSSLDKFYHNITGASGGDDSFLVSGRNKLSSKPKAGWGIQSEPHGLTHLATTFRNRSKQKEYWNYMGDEDAFVERTSTMKSEHDVGMRKDKNQPKASSSLLDLSSIWSNGIFSSIAGGGANGADGDTAGGKGTSSTQSFNERISEILNASATLQTKKDTADSSHLPLNPRFSSVEDRIAYTSLKQKVETVTQHLEQAMSNDPNANLNPQLFDTLPSDDIIDRTDPANAQIDEMLQEIEEREDEGYEDDDEEFEDRPYQHPLLQDLDPFTPPESVKDQDMWDVSHIFPSESETTNASASNYTAELEKELAMYEVPERAWWIDAFDNDEFRKIDLDQVDLVELVKDILQKRGGTNGRAIDDKGDNMELDEVAIESIEVDLSTKVGHEDQEEKDDTSVTSSSTCSSTPSSLDQEEWEERIWASARTHHCELDLSVLGSGLIGVPTKDQESKQEIEQRGDTDDVKSLVDAKLLTKGEQEQRQVFQFRILLQRCLFVYYMMFHDSFRHYDEVKEAPASFLESLVIPKYVPLPVVRVLMEVVIQQTLKDDGIDQADDDDGIVDEEQEKNLVHSVMNALLGKELGVFRVYEVTKQQDDTASQQESKDETNVEEDVNSKDADVSAVAVDTEIPDAADYDDRYNKFDKINQQHIVSSHDRYRARIDLDEVRKRKELDLFLYGDLKADDEKIQEEKISDSETKSNKLDCEYREQEICMSSSFAQYVPSFHAPDSEDFIRVKKWSERCCYNALLHYSKQDDGLITMIKKWSQSLAISSSEHATDSSNTSKPFQQNLLLAQVYMMKYGPTLLFRSFFLNTILEQSNLNVDRLHSSMLNQFYKLLTDSTYIQMRVSAFGSYEGLKDHFAAFGMYGTLKHCISCNCDPVVFFKTFSVAESSYVGESYRQDYYDFHCAILTIVQEIVTSTMNDNENESIAEEIVSNADRRIQRLQEFLSGQRKRKEETSFDDIIRFFDFGRSLYNVGIEIGRREKNYNTIGSNMKDSLTTAIFQAEMKSYDLASDIYKEALTLLSGFEAQLESTGTKDGASTVQMYDVVELKVSGELFFADTLAALGFCCDTKVSHPQRAIQVYKEALAIYKRHFGKFHHTIANTLQNLGGVYCELKKWNESIRCYRQRLGILKNCREEESEEKDNKEPTLQKYYKTDEEIAETLRSIAKIYDEVDSPEASQFYSASTRILMSLLKSNESDKESLKVMISEDLLGMAYIHIKHASSVNLSWHAERLQTMFSHHSIDSAIEHQDYLLSHFYEIEQSAINCFHELGMLQQFRENIVTTSSSSIKISIDIGKLKFRHRSYVDAELHWIEAWNCLLSRSHVSLTDLDHPSNSVQRDDSDLNPALVQHLTADEVHIAIPLLFLLGNVSCRLRKFKRALSCITFAKDLLISQSSDMSLEMRMDLAKLDHTIGFIYFETDEYRVAADKFRSVLREYDQIMTIINEEMQGDQPIDDEKFRVQEARVMMVKVLIGEALNLLGACMHVIDRTEIRALRAFEESMLQLDGVLDMVQDIDLMTCTNAFVDTLLLHNISSTVIAKSIGDSYYRAGKLYMKQGLVEDAAISFERSIEILESLSRGQDENLRVDDEGMIAIHDEEKIEEDLALQYQLLWEIRDLDDETLTLNLGVPPEIESPHFSTEDLLFRLGNVSLKRDQFSSAVKMFSEARSLTEKRLGSSNHIIVANLLHNEGLAHKEIFLASNGKLIEAKVNAVQCFEQSIDLSRNLYGGKHIFTAESMFQLVSLMMADDDFLSKADQSKEVEKWHLYMKEVLRMKTLLLGELHCDVATTYQVLGCFYLRRGDIESTNKAINAFKRALNIRKRIVGSQDTDVSDILQNIGLAYKQQAGNYNKKRDDHYQIQLELSMASFKEAFFVMKRSAMSIDTYSSRWRRYCIEAVNNLFHCLEISNIWGIESGIMILEKILQLLCTLDEVARHGSKSSIHVKHEKNLIRRHVATAWVQVASLEIRRGRVVNSIKCLLKSSMSKERVWREGDEMSIDVQTTLCQANLWFKLSCTKKCIRLFANCSKACTDMIALSFPIMQMARLYSSFGDDGKALKLLTKAESCLSKIKGDQPPLLVKSSKALLHHYLSLICQRRKHTTKAFEHANEAINLIDDIKAEAYDSISFLHESPSKAISTFMYQQNWSLRMLECYTVMFQLGFLKLHQTNQMEVISEILQRIGSTYTDFGHYATEKALQMFLSVLSFRCGAHDENDLGVGDLLFNIGNLYLQRNQHSLAKLCHEESHRISSNVFGSDSTELIESLMLLAQTCYNLREYEKSDRSLNQAMDLMQKVQDTRHRNAMKCKILQMKGDCYEKLGKLNASRSCLQKAILLSSESVANDHVDVGSVLSSLGNVLFSLRDYEGASLTLSKCMKIRVESKDTIGVARTRSHIGNLLAALGARNHSKAICFEALRVNTIMVAGDSVDSARMLCRLGQLLAEENDIERALELLHESLRMFKYHFSHESYEVALCLFRIGLCYEKSCAFDKAQGCYMSSLSALENNTLMGIDAMKTLSHVYHNMGKLAFDHFRQNENSVKYLTKALDKKIQSFGQDHPTTAKTRQCYAEVLYHLGHLDSSLKHFKLSAKTFAQHSGKESSPFLKSILGISRVLLKEGKCEEVIRSLTEIGSSRKRCMDEFETGSSILLGDAYRNMKMWSDAKDHYFNAMENIHKVSWLPGCEDSYACRNYSLCLSEIGEFDLARKQLKKYLDDMDSIENMDLKREEVYVLESLGIVEQKAHCYTQAIAYFDKALAMSKSLFGENDESLFRLVQLIAVSNSRNGNFDISLQFYNESLRRGSVLYGKGDRRIVETRLEEAKVLLLKGDTSLSLKKFLDIIEIFESPETEFDVCETIDIHMAVGTIYLQSNEDKAREHFTLAQAILENAVVTDQSYLPKLEECCIHLMRLLDSQEANGRAKARLCYRLGDICVKLSNMNEAQEWYEKALSHQLQMNDKELSIANTLHNLGNCAASMGSIKMATSLYNQSLQRSHRVLGECSKDVADTMFALAQMYHEDSNFNQSINLFEQVLTARERICASSTEVAAVMQALGHSFLLKGNYESALKYCHKSLSILPATLSSNHPSASESHFYLGQIYRFMGQYENSIFHLKRARHSAVETGLLKYEMGTTYDKRGQEPKAQILFSSARDEIEKMLKIDKSMQSVSDLEKLFVNGQSIHSSLLSFADLVYLYGKLLLKDDRLEQAMVCFDFSFNSYQERLGPSCLRLANALYHKGLCLIKGNSFQQAYHLLSTASSIYEKVLDADHHCRKDVSYVLSECHYNMGNIDIAMDMMQDTFTSTYWFQSTVLDKTYQESVFHMAMLYHEKEKLSEAMQYYNNFMKMSKSMISRVKGMHAVGKLMFDSGNYRKATACYLKALTHLEGNKGECYYNIILSMGSLYYECGRLEDSLNCYKSIADNEESENGPNETQLVQALSNLGDVHFKLHKLSEAKMYYGRSIKLLQKNGGSEEAGYVWLSLGEVYLAEKCMREALSSFQSCLQIMNTLFDASSIQMLRPVYGVGVCLLSLGEYNDAMSSLSEALRLGLLYYIEFESSFSDVYLHLARCCLAMGNQQSALDYFNQYVTLKLPKLSDGMKEEEIAKLDECLDCSIRIQKDSGSKDIRYAEYNQNKGVCYALRNSNKKAIHYFAKSVAIYSKISGRKHICVSNALFNIGICMKREEQLEDATKYLHRALEIARTSSDDTFTSDILDELGQCYRSQSRRSEAKRCFEEVLDMMKESSRQKSEKAATIMESIGDILLDEGKVEAAESHYMESLKLKTLFISSSDMARFLYKLGTFFMTAKKYTNALHEYEKSLSLSRIEFGDADPSVINTYLNLGIVHHILNNTEKALQCYDFCIEHDVSNDPVLKSKVLAKKAESLCRHHKFDEAMACLTHALSLRNDDEDEEVAEIMLNQGVVYKQLGDTEQAMLNFKSALFMYEACVGRDNLGVSKTLHIMAELLLGEGKLDYAYQCAAESVDIRQKIHGNNHSDTSFSLFCKGLILYELGEKEMALSCLLLSEFVMKNSNRTGKKHRLMIAHANFLVGCIHESMEDYDAALASLKASLVVRQKILGVHIDVAMTLQHIGNVHKAQNQLKNAVLCYRNSLFMLLGIEGLNNNVAEVLLSLGDAFNIQSKPQHAQFCLSESIEIYESSEKESSQVRINLAKSFGIMGQVYIMEDDLQESIRWYKKATKAFNELYANKELEKQDLLLFASTINQFAKVYHSLGDEGHAVRQYSMALHVYKSVLGKTNLWSADILESIANLRGRRMQYDKASILLEETLRIRLEILGPDHVAISNVLFSLGVVFDKKGEYEAAKNAFLDCLSIRYKVYGTNRLEYADTLSAFGTCLCNTQDFAGAFEVWDEAKSIYINDLHLDANDPKLQNLTDNQKEATKLLKQKKSRWGTLRVGDSYK